jgi:Mce-associated membrane protein
VKDESKGLLPMVLAFVAGVVLVAIVATGVMFFRQANQRGDELNAQNDAAAAACNYAQATNSYDYTKSLDDFLAKAKEGATSNVVQMLEQNWQVMRQLLTESKVTSKVAQAACGFKSGDSEKATVLVKLTLEITNSVTPVAKQQGLAVSAGLEKSGDKWLVNKWDLVVQPTDSGRTGGGAPTPETHPTPGPQPGN